MTKRILITALYGDASGSDISYCSMKDETGRTLYCDACIPAEAACKYVLSAFPIDEIIVFGSGGACPAGAEETVTLRDAGKALLTGLEAPSEYEMLQYRLLQFLEEVNAEAADQDLMLSKEQQQETIAFLRRFFHDEIGLDGEKKYNRYFHYLAQDPELWGKLENAMRTGLSGAGEDLARYRTWVLSYLYRDLKATAKLEPLEQNISVRMRSFCAEEGDILSFLNGLMPALQGYEADDGIPNSIELYVCLPGEHVFGIFTLLNAMNLTKVIPGEQVSISRVVTETRRKSSPFSAVFDQTEEYGISGLLAATRAFLRYGKTDLLVDYWEKAQLKNPKIDRIIYAIRNIDFGISLCDITDIERGIKSLRSVIRNDLPIRGETVIEQYFGLVMDSIQQDYGALLESDQFSFIDLVKWAYGKGFWQQTLTLIESRAPSDFVEKGIFFYSDGEKSRRKAIQILGQAYYDLRPYEKYKLDDVSHYFVKYCDRNRASRSGDGDTYQMNYTEFRLGEMDTQDDSLIRPLTICPDRAALKDLLFAYYHAGDVRNVTNHAMEEYDGFYTIMPDTDPGERMKIITQAVDFFIHCYDRVFDLIEGKKANVVTVKTSELAEQANEIRIAGRRERDNSRDNTKDNSSEAAAKQ